MREMPSLVALYQREADECVDFENTSRIDSMNSLRTARGVYLLNAQAPAEAGVTTQGLNAVSVDHVRLVHINRSFCMCSLAHTPLSSDLPSRPIPDESARQSVSTPS